MEYSHRNRHVLQQHPPSAKGIARAISWGESLKELKGAPETLAAALAATAEKFPDKALIYLQPDGSASSQSYLSLFKAAERIRQGLVEQGLQPQDKVILQIEDNQAFVEGFWGCLLGGFVPVPLAVASADASDSDKAKALYHSWQIFQQPLVITSEGLTASILALADRWQQTGYRTVAIEELRNTPIETPPTWHKGHPDDLALLFLNARYGPVPKGVQLSHRNIIHNIKAHVQKGWLRSEDVYLNWLPLYNPGPLLRSVIWTTYLGIQQVQGEVTTVLGNPLKWLDWIEQYRVTLAWAPNFAFGLLNDRADKIASGQWDLSSVRHWLNTAEPIVPKTGQTFLQLMAPHGLTADTLYGVWGMKETAASATASNRYASDAQIAKDSLLADLGLPLPGFGLRIVNDQAEILPEKTIGHLQVKGEAVSAGYYQSPALNRDVFTSDGWYKTGDLGFLSEGRLTLTGRSKSLIIIHGKNHYSHEIEQVVESVEGIEPNSVAACGMRTPGSDTDSVVVFFSVKSADELQVVQRIQAIKKSVTAKVGIAPAQVLPIPPTQMPRTADGSLDRKRLLARFEAKAFEDISQRVAERLARVSRSDRAIDSRSVSQSAPQSVSYIAPESSIEKILLDIWQTLLEVDRIGVQENFFTLGGHSLMAARLLAQIRRTLAVDITVQTFLQAPTIAQLSVKVSNELVARSLSQTQATTLKQSSLPASAHGLFCSVPA